MVSVSVDYSYILIGTSQNLGEVDEVRGSSIVVPLRAKAAISLLQLKHNLKTDRRGLRLYE